VVANRLAPRKAPHERPEARERRREVVLVEAGDRRGDLRLVVARPQPSRPGVDALCRVLVTLALQERALQEQPVVTLLLEDGIEAVPGREVLRVEDLVGAHLVVRVAPRGLRRAERLRGFAEVAGAEEDDPAIELHDRVLGGSLGDGCQREGGLLRGQPERRAHRGDLGGAHARHDQRLRSSVALAAGLRRRLPCREHDARHDPGRDDGGQAHDQADAGSGGHGAKVDDRFRGEVGMKAPTATVYVVMPTYRDLLQATKASISEVDAEAARALDGALWVDVREVDEWQEGHIPNAVHVPRGHLESRVEGVAPDRSAPVVIYCAAGNRSAFAAKSLEELGYEHVHSLVGGFTDWKRNGGEVVLPRTLSPEKRTRYSRHLLIPEIGEEGQLKLLDSKILLIGAGGLGSPASLYLAAAGIGTLGIVDADIVDETNLQRQIAHSLDTLGTPKVDSAKRAIEALNPDVNVVTYRERLTSENIDRILDDGWDLIVDGADNFPTRYLVNDASVWRGIPVVHGSIYRFEGQVTVFKPHDGPCYRCLFPEPPPVELAPSCSEGGVLGVLPGIVGTLQTNEAIKLAAGIGESLVGRLLLLDALATEFNEVKIERRDDCPVCGDHPTITEYIDYVEFCAR
jgi:sulfur-carrier protein adenylyltransferase/sulfurtransferase